MRAYYSAKRRWTRADLARMRAMALARVPTRVIARRLGRTPTAIRMVAHRHRLALSPARGWRYFHAPVRRITVMQSLEAALRDPSLARPITDGTWWSVAPRRPLRRE
jgi:hypothetical protein